jgi:SAM-dependent methyltransferase
MIGRDDLSSRDLEAEFEKLGPWIYKFRVQGADYGGGISAVGDERLAQFFQFAPEARTILELGSLEGAQTMLLAARRSVRRVLAIEGRAVNIRKAIFIQGLLDIRNVAFVHANLEETDLAAFGTFDAVFCSGLLYHLPQPWKLIAQLPRLAPKLFLWTHYADDSHAEVLQHGLRGQIHPEGGADEPLSGLSDTAFWPTLESLIKLLTTSGYQTIHVIQNDLEHSNAPAVTIAATSGRDASRR